MAEPAIITAAITGAVPRKKDNPAVPVAPSEQAEVFDLAMLYNAANLVKKGLLKDPPHVQVVMGIPNAMPARRSIFDFLRSELKQVLPRATWVAAGVARHQWEVNQWCMETGGHCRTGLEDNLRIEPERLAASNAELVKKVVDACERFGRRPATPRGGTADSRPAPRRVASFLGNPIRSLSSA